MSPHISRINLTGMWDFVFCMIQIETKMRIMKVEVLASSQAVSWAEGRWHDDTGGWHGWHVTGINESSRLTWPKVEAGGLDQRPCQDELREEEAGSWASTHRQNSWSLLKTPKMTSLDWNSLGNSNSCDSIHNVPLKLQNRQQFIFVHEWANETLISSSPCKAVWDFFCSSLFWQRRVGTQLGIRCQSTCKVNFVTWYASVSTLRLRCDWQLN